MYPKTNSLLPISKKTTYHMRHQVMLVAKKSVALDAPELGSNGTFVLQVPQQ